MRTLLMLLSDFLQSCISGQTSPLNIKLAWEMASQAVSNTPILKISFVIFACVHACMHMCMCVWMPMQAHAVYRMLVDHVGCFLLPCVYRGCV